MFVSFNFVHGEVKGPIIGTEEVDSFNSRIPSADGRTVSIDEKGNYILPSIVYFGKYDGGEYSHIPVEAMKIKPNYLLPFGGTIINCSIHCLYQNQHPLKETFRLIFRITKSYSGKHNPAKFKDVVNFKYGTIEGEGETKEYIRELTTETEFGDIAVQKCFSDPEFDEINFDDCPSLILYFASSHPSILKCTINLTIISSIENLIFDNDN